MRWVLLLPCLWASAFVASAQETSAPAKTPANALPIQLVLELSDGSRVVGTPAVHRLKMVADYANLDIPLSLVRTIEFSGTNSIAQLNLQNGDRLSVQLSATEIALKTSFGQAVIPMTQVRRIRVNGGAGKPLPDGLVLHYTFDVDEGARVTDMSGGGNDGKVQGATYTNEGKPGGAMSFNGDREAVIVGNPSSLQLQDFTIMAWIKRGSVNKTSGREGDDAELFGYGHGGYMMGMCVDGRLFLSKVDLNDVDSQFAIRDDAFHHVAVTKKGSQIVYYLDGVGSPAPDYDPGFEFDTDAAVGSRADTLAHSFFGMINEVAVFNRALSGDEIKGIYDSQK
jgi:hypothetical protein